MQKNSETNLLQIENQKFKKYTKQIKKKKDTKLLYNISLSVQKLTTIIQHELNPDIIPILYELWDCCLQIFPFVEIDVTFLNFVHTIIVHPQFYQSFLKSNVSSLFS